MRVRLAAWYAGAGVVVLVSGLMAALIGGIWIPTSRAVVLLVLLIGLPGAACAFAVAGYFAADRALAPLRLMVERTRRLSAQSLSERLPIVNTQDELGQLASVFNGMLGRLEDSFAELRRFGEAFGARPATLMGLSGLGDLVLTCASAQSRNFAFGVALGQGRSAAAAGAGKLAEGATTAMALMALARARNIEMPIAAAVEALLKGEIDARAALAGLLSRPQRGES